MVLRDAGVDRKGSCVSFDGEVASNDDVEFQIARRWIFDGFKSNVVDMRMWEIVSCTRNAEINLSWQVCHFWVSSIVICDHFLQSIANGTRIDQFMRIQSSNGIARQISNVVHSGLKRRHSDGFQFLDNIWNGIQRHASQLNPGTRRNVRTTRIAKRFDAFSHRSQLCSAEFSIWDLDRTFLEAFGEV